MPRSLLAILVVSAACTGGTDAPPPSPEGCDDEAPWRRAPNLPLGATQETATVALDGKIYVLGGFNGALGVVDAVQVFEIASCTWSLGPPLPGPMHHINAAVVGDTIYIVGALVGDDFSPIGDTWSWAPSRSSTWTRGQALPPGSERGAAAVAAIGEQIYVAGGLRGAASVADVSVYDVTQQRWDTSLPPLPSGRDHACGAVVAGAFYVIGGRRVAVLDAVLAYTPGTGWQSRASMPTARGGVACGVVGAEVVVVGGEGNPNSGLGVFPEVEAYRPASDSWRSLPRMRTPRHGMGAAAVARELYVPGGATRAGFGASSRFEILTVEE